MTTPLHIKWLRSDARSSLQTDLDRINNILVLVQELNAETEKTPPDIAVIKSKAQAINSETQQVQGSIDRLQETAKIVSDSKDDILKVVAMNDDVQERIVKIQPLMTPMQDLFGVCLRVCAYGLPEHVKDVDCCGYSYMRMIIM
jgi:hypothetical protein